MNDRRRPDIRVLPDGSLWAEDVYRDHIGAIERRAARPVVRRLSALPDVDTRPEWVRRLKAKDMTDRSR